MEHFLRNFKKPAARFFTKKRFFQKMAKNRFFPLNLATNGQKNAKKTKNAFFGDFSIFKFLLTRSLRNGFQKFNVLFTETSISFGCCNSGFIEAMDLNFFLNDCKFYVDAKNAIKEGSNSNSSRDIGD